MKKITLKDLKQTQIVSEMKEYNYIDEETSDVEILFHFFNMQFEFDTEKKFLVCHVYTRWEDDNQQYPECKVYMSLSLDSLDFNEINYNFLNSKYYDDLEKIILKEVFSVDPYLFVAPFLMPDSSYYITDVSFSIRDEVRKSFYI